MRERGKRAARLCSICMYRRCNAQVLRSPQAQRTAGCGRHCRGRQTNSADLITLNRNRI